MSMPQAADKKTIGRAPAGRAIHCKSSPLVPRGCGLSATIPHAAGRHLVFALLATATLSLSLSAQKRPQLHFDSSTDTTGLYKEFGQHKKLPQGFEWQALIALSYFPELKDTEINFCLEKDDVPLTTMPSFWGIFKKPENRAYNITISTEGMEALNPILLKNLGTGAQIGVLGHELGHVSDFQHFNCWDFLVHALRYTFSATYGDKFEFNTDRICIDHGLGYQLLAWSLEVRQKLDVKAFLRGQNISPERERYMHPATIEKIISQHPLYQTH